MSDPTTPIPTENLKDYVLRSPRTPWMKFRSWLTTPVGFGTAVFALAVLALVVQARPLYRAAKAMRVQRIVAQAELAHEKGDSAAETRLLREAVSLLPAHVLTWRARAHYQERRADPAALASYRRLLESEGANADDAEKACRFASMRGTPETCSEIMGLAHRIPGATERPAVMGLQARALAAEGKFSAATALAEKAAALAPGEGWLRLLQANLLMQSADHVDPAERPEVARRSIAILDELSQGMDKTAAQALEILLQIVRRPAAAAIVGGFDVNAWTTAAERHPAGEAKLRMLAWNQQLVGRKVDVPAFLDGFVERWQKAPEGIQLEAARWLNQTGNSRYTLRLSNVHKDLSEDWFVLHVDALAATQQWSTILELLAQPEGQATSLPAAIRTLFSLKARAELGEPVDADEDWREIMLQLHEAPVRTQVFVAQYSERTGELKKAATIYRRTLQSSSATTSTLDSHLDRDLKLACYTGILRCTPMTAPASDVLPIMEAMAADFREIQAVHFDTLYLRVLTRTVDERTRAEVLKLRSSSDTLPVRSLVSLLELRSGNPIAAAQAYDGFSAHWDQASDALKVVRAAVLTAVGKEEESQELRAKIREHRLRPEELALLHPPPVAPPAEEPSGPTGTAPALPGDVLDPSLQGVR